MKVVIMQPYLFPYFGYFSLLKNCDKFVFYDDVNFINKGWINRNNLLINKKACLFTVPLSKASQNKYINEIKLFQFTEFKRNFYSLLKSTYSKAPFFQETIGYINNVFDCETDHISDLAIRSIKIISEILGLKKKFFISSVLSPNSKVLSRSDRLIELTSILSGDEYINSLGGAHLYSESYFAKHSIKLTFHEPKIFPYKQFNSPNQFIPNLSIIDLLMNKSPDQINSELI